MIERSSEDIAAMRRRELADVHMREMNAALFPFQGRADDDIGAEEKTAISSAVQELVQLHRAEIRIWQAANG